ncbi:MAG: hypothetical protein OXT09_06035 [Myxococcales bacterium]|nr:hypothetical protein [Myxococcales bacterium]
MRTIVTGIAVALVTLACACSDDGDQGDDGSAVEAECATGTSYSCQGPLGCSGRQFCRGDGTLSACTCEDGSNDTGQPGDGSAGTGGDGDDGSGAPPGDGDSGGDGDDTGDGDAGDGDAGDGDGGDGDAGDGDAGDGDASEADEDCDNGEDDDGDGDVDCADADCGALRCVEPAPDGWSGPLALWAGSGTPPDCGDGFGETLLTGGRNIGAPAASCSTCTCDGSSCGSFVDVGTGTVAGCDGASCSTSLNGSCAELSTPCLMDTDTAYLETRLPSEPAACEASAQDADVAAASFAEEVRGCGVDEVAARGCEGGEVCAPADEPDGFEAPLCILTQGEEDCPDGPYSERTLYFTGIDDDRGCSACGCDAPDCNYSWSVYASADDLCESPLITLNAAEQCVQVSPTDGAIRVGVAITGDGTCAPTGGQPTGEAIGTGAVTVCCED